MCYSRHAEPAVKSGRGGADMAVLTSRSPAKQPRSLAASLDPAPAQAASPLALQVVAGLSCITWMMVSAALILVNKFIMSRCGFHYPMALSSLGMGFSAVASYVYCQVLGLVPVKQPMSGRFYLSHIVPVGLFMATSLHFGNLVYLYLTVSFIQMLKAFTPVVTMVALFAAALEAPSALLVGAIVTIAAGTAAASYGELNMNGAGLAFMLASQASEAARLVMTQLLLTGLNFHPIEALMYMAPACCLWLGAGVALFEWRTMVAEGALALVAARPLLYLSAAAMGFGVNALACIVIQTASSLTLKVLGTVKDAGLVWFSVLFLRETVTALQGAGYAVSLAGFCVYNYVKLRQFEPKASESRRGPYTALPAAEDPKVAEDSSL